MLIHRNLFFFLMNLLLVLPCAAPASASEPVRYFEYWSEYGADMREGAFRKASLSLYSGHVSIFFEHNGKRDNYAGSPCRGNILSEFAALAEGLDLSRWETPVTEKAFAAMKAEEKKKYCRWHMVIAYGSPAGGGKAREVRLEGADSGANPGRAAAEKAFAAFFGEKLRMLQAECPKHIGNMHWSMPAGGGRADYFLMKENGRVKLSRIAGGKSVECCVWPGVMEEIEAVLKRSGAEAWNGAGSTMRRSRDPAVMELFVQYDTLQNIGAYGLADGEQPAGMKDVLLRLSETCAWAADMAAARQLRPGALTGFRFAQHGMMRGACPGYELYSRMDRAGPVTVLERENGEEHSERVVTDADVRKLELLLGECGVASWNGFSGSARNVLDGRSFSFHAEYEDGRSVSAHGYMKFPKNYGSVRERVFSFLDGLFGDAVPGRGTERQ